MTTDSPAPEQDPERSPSQRAERPTRHRALDLLALATLLILATCVYLAVGSDGFSVITGAGVGLYGVWRARR